MITGSIKGRQGENRCLMKDHESEFTIRYKKHRKRVRKKGKNNRERYYVYRVYTSRQDRNTTEVH